MQTNKQVADAFWAGKKAASSTMTSTGNKLFSYSTCILQRLPSGKVLANITKYSSTTSKHQSLAGVIMADEYVPIRVPRGVADLAALTGKEE